MYINKFVSIAVLAYLYILLSMVLFDTMTEGVKLNAEKAGRHQPVDANIVHRKYILWSRCTGKHVQIIGDRITALGSENSPHANLRVESHSIRNKDGNTILGLKSGRYLCFNKKGRVIARFNGHNRRCLFQEEFSGNDTKYTIFRSLYNHNWLLGFNRRGRPLNGADLTKRQRLPECFHFMKRNHTYLDLDDRNQPGPRLPDPSRVDEYLLHQGRMRRHRRHHHLRPMR